MYGEIQIKINNELYIYKEILNIEYELEGEYLPEILYPNSDCRESEYPEMIIKAFIIEGTPKEIEFNKVDEIKIISLDLDIEPCEYKLEYKINNFTIKNNIIVIEVI